MVLERHAVMNKILGLVSLFLVNFEYNVINLTGNLPFHDIFFEKKIFKNKKDKRFTIYYVLIAI